MLKSEGALLTLSREWPLSSSLVSLVMPAHSSGMQSSPTCQLSLLCSPVIFNSSNCMQNTIVKVENVCPAKQQQLLSACLMSILGCFSCSHKSVFTVTATVASWSHGPHQSVNQPLDQFPQYTSNPPPPQTPPCAAVLTYHCQHLSTAW